MKNRKFSALLSTPAGADVVEAMAAHRPYRPGLGIEVALEEIIKNQTRF